MSNVGESQHLIFPLLSVLLLEHCLKLDYHIDLILCSATDPIFLEFKVTELLFIPEEQGGAHRAWLIM